LTNPHPKKLAYTEKEFLEIFPVSPRKLYSMRCKNEIPHTKFGNRIYYPVAEIEQWWAAWTQGGKP
jgi:hypothetical protein